MLENFLLFTACRNEKLYLQTLYTQDMYLPSESCLLYRFLKIILSSESFIYILLIKTRLLRRKQLVQLIPNQIFAFASETCFLSSRVCLRVYQIFQNFESLYHILHILTQAIQKSCLVTHFCAQAVFKVPVSNTFPTHAQNDIIRNNFSARCTRMC